jgi:hypothetical protein
LAGLFLGVLVQVFDKKTGIIQAHRALTQSVFSLLSVIIITLLGFKIMMTKTSAPTKQDEYELSLNWNVKRNKPSRFDVFATSFLPFIYIINQSLGAPQIVQVNTHII